MVPSPCQGPRTSIGEGRLPSLGSSQESPRPRSSLLLFFITFELNFCWPGHVSPKVWVPRVKESIYRLRSCLGPSRTIFFFCRSFLFFKIFSLFLVSVRESPSDLVAVVESSRRDTGDGGEPPPAAPGHLPAPPPPPPSLARLRRAPPADGVPSSTGPPRLGLRVARFEAPGRPPR